MCKERNFSFPSHGEKLPNIPSKHLNGSILDLNHHGDKFFTDNCTRFLLKSN